MTPRIFNVSTTDRSQAGLWIFLYFAANLLLTLHNKWVLSRLQFNFPWTLTALHIGISGVGAYFLLNYYYHVTPTKLSRDAMVKLLLFSVLYSVNIAISNVSLSHVSLAFHQLVRSATPAITVVMELALFRKIHSARIYLSLLPVVIGICLATVDEFSDVSFTLAGFLLTLLGVILSCLKGIVTNVLMVGPLKMHPLEVIWRMSLPSVLQCLSYAAFFGELGLLPGFFHHHHPDKSSSGNRFDSAAAGKLLFNGFLAMWLNWVSFTANKKTSALTMTVAGNIKQALSILLAIYFFGSRLSRVNLIGIIVALSGGACYRYADRMRRKMNSLYLSHVVTNHTGNGSVKSRKSTIRYYNQPLIKCL